MEHHEQKPFLIAVAGPTAGGKSSLALAICEEFSGELISCDSMQIYRRMDIGTAKPTPEEMARVPHHLINICDPDEDFSAATFAEVATKAIDDVLSRGRLPVLCGGTGLYLDSVLKGVDYGEMEPDLHYRAEMQTYAEENSVIALHDKLKALDPEAAEVIHPNNIKRVIRALEIIHLSGMTKTEWDRQALRRETPYRETVIALDYRDRETLYRRIEMRVDQMFEMGLVEEARALYDAGFLAPNTTAGGAIGYKELLGYLRGEMTLEEAKDTLKTATRHYAKRQLTWLRKNPSVQWFYPDDYASQTDFTSAVFDFIRKLPR